MTEKEKAEAYDKAIERAKKLYDNGITEEIFPELKEDDDERIKKDLIQWVDEFPDIIWRGHYKKDIIAWLEKQGKQKRQVHFPKFTFDDILALQCCMVTVKNVQEDNELYEQLNLIHNKMYDTYRLGKQGETSPILSNSSNNGKNEQTPADKVEPKFKVGDWIISSVLGTARIIGVNDSNEFQLEYTDGKQKFSSIDYVNYAYDKWTINNVKDGDVLFTSSSACSDTFVFKSIDEKGNAECYFAYDSEDGFTEGKYHFIGSASDCKPATKAQCDFLMKAMKDARYEWDSEKKELKKLVEPKFKVGDKITNSFRKYVGASGSQVIISEITEDKYIFTDGSYIFISNQDSWELVSDKKPKFDPETMKTYNDINIGDTVYIWGSGDSSVDETTITEKYDDRGHWNLKFSNGCVGRALKNGTSSTMGMYACLVYSDKEAVRESINEQIKILTNIKI